MDTEKKEGRRKTKSEDNGGWQAMLCTCNINLNIVQPRKVPESKNKKVRLYVHLTMPKVRCPERHTYHQD